MVFTDFIYRRLLEKIAAEKHEEQPARETDTQQVCKNRNGQMSNVDISVPFKDSSTDPSQGQSCAKSQTHQRNEDEQEGPPPEERRGQEEGESVQNAQRVRRAMSYKRINKKCSQGSDESYSEPDDDESYQPSPEEYSDLDDRYQSLLEHVRPLQVPLNGQVINWALLNCRSIVNTPINQLLHDNNLQVFILTETWLERATADQELRIRLANTYNFVQWARVNVRGGGVAIIFLNELQGTWIDLSHPTTAFEYVAALLSLGVGGPRVLVIAVYRPPSRNFDQFTNEFQDLLNIARGRYEDGNIILAGDFNVGVNRNSRRTRTFLQLLHRNGFVQHVAQPTHQRGNTLDLVISSRNVEITVLMVLHDTTSDHFNVYFRLLPIRRDGEQESEAEDEEDE